MIQFFFLLLCQMCNLEQRDEKGQFVIKKSLIEFVKLAIFKTVIKSSLNLVNLLYFNFSFISLRFRLNDNQRQNLIFNVDIEES